MFLFLDLEVHVLFQLPSDPVRLGIPGHVVVGRTRDDQRRPRFVHENIVDLVDDRVMQLTLALLPLVGVSWSSPKAAGFMLSRR